MPVQLIGHAKGRSLLVVSMTLFRSVVAIIIFTKDAWTKQRINFNTSSGEFPDSFNLKLSKKIAKSRQKIKLNNQTPCRNIKGFGHLRAREKFLTSEELYFRSPSWLSNEHSEVFKLIFKLFRIDITSPKMDQTQVSTVRSM